MLRRSLDNPTAVIGEVAHPLLWPEDALEVDGDACGNVVFSCGAFVDGEDLVVAFGKGDQATGFAICNLHDLLYLGMQKPLSPPLPGHWLTERGRLLTESSEGSQP